MRLCERNIVGICLILHDRIMVDRIKCLLQA